MFRRRRSAEEVVAGAATAGAWWGLGMGLSNRVIVVGLFELLDRIYLDF